MARRKTVTTTVYPAEPHNLAKIAVLENYLRAAFPTLARGGAPYERTAIRYVDAFSGAGVYSGGELGSPLKAVEAARSFSSLPLPVHLHFIDDDQARVDHLTNELAVRHGDLRPDSFIQIHDPIQADCRDVLPDLITELESEGNRLGGSFFFLDQFGYAAVPMGIVERILAMPRSEAFVFLNYRDMNIYFTDETKHDSITRAYGGDGWKAALGGSRSQVEEVLYDAYESALRTAGAKYVRSFSMYDANDNLLYWLFFCTNNPKGLFEMKRSMWKVDPNGDFRFSDKTRGFRGSKLFFSGYDDDWLADYLADALKGRRLTKRQLNYFVLEKTPCFRFKRALQKLVRDGTVHIVAEAPAPSGLPFQDVANDVLQFS